MRVFDSTAYGTRKVVVSTNLAETSVTITGICFVVDCGKLIFCYNRRHSVEPNVFRFRQITRLQS